MLVMEVFHNIPVVCISLIIFMTERVVEWCHENYHQKEGDAHYRYVVKLSWSWDKSCLSILA